MKNLKHSLSALLASTLVFQSAAFATDNINVQTFNPSTSDHFVFLEDGFHSDWPKTAKYYFGLNYNYTNDPLVALDPTQSNKAYNIINSVQTFDLMAGMRLSERVGLFIGLPIHEVSFNNAAPDFFPKNSATSIGDLKFLGKIRVTDDDSPTSVAIIPEFHAPTGSSTNFVSDSGPYFALRGALERKFTNWTFAANLGYAYAPNSIYNNANYTTSIDYRNRLIAGIGGFLPFNDAWGMNLEFNNISMIPFNSAFNPNDAYLGLRFVASDGLIFTGGASIGEIGGPEGVNYRIVGGIRYTISEEQKAAPKPAPVPEAVPAPTPVSSVHIEVHGNRSEIVTPTINFEHNSYKLAPDSKETLDMVADLIIKNRGQFKKILVDGHTNNIGKDAYNMKLSLARAKSVKHYLMTKGVQESELEARGFGMRNPKVLYNVPGALEINRRVEFLIVK